REDLTRIEGIGPKICALLVDEGIETFQCLSQTTVPTLRKILDAAGGSFRSHDPTTWPEQATMAANGQWDELERLQNVLNAGRRVA
ncbi:MAG: DUF4332 domain-containing protein, partial [Pirellulaceae bacterium]|nr:DUF4332 domain-containing protein [Pirellulaceae bacterium]